MNSGASEGGANGHAPPSVVLVPRPAHGPRPTPHGSRDRPSGFGLCMLTEHRQQPRQSRTFRTRQSGSGRTVVKPYSQIGVATRREPNGRVGLGSKRRGG